ncbi:MAG TPA: GIY-YIG nuclease family protein, partial [Candidatus Gracilibacteria bacterium]|nr:GIY-YIG nuclease family protein [Candidatus Gracilibacteria bacterium]
MNETSKKIKTVLKNLPDKPGVYKMIDSGGRVIYIGKAKNLKKRVGSYFQKTKTFSTRTQKLVENVDDISYTVVNSELEALILELNLIKELRPKYNILLKDDKNYVYIKITKEDFPRIQIVRKIDDRKATYFGPKTSKAKVEKTFQMLKKVFHFRHCNLDIEALEDKNKQLQVKVSHETIKYPCLDYYIKRCSAPCIANISKEEYNEAIENIKRFFEGHHDEIIKNIKKQMMELATNKEFEKAARLRDTLQSIESILERQSISDPNQEDK